jgi:hypothetical protein
MWLLLFGLLASLVLQPNFLLLSVPSLVLHMCARVATSFLMALNYY